MGLLILLYIHCFTPQGNIQKILDVCLHIRACLRACVHAWAHTHTYSTNIHKFLHPGADLTRLQVFSKLEQSSVYLGEFPRKLGPHKHVRNVQQRSKTPASRTVAICCKGTRTHARTLARTHASTHARTHARIFAHRHTRTTKA